MIKNERQYRITRTQAARFRRAIVNTRSRHDPGVHPVLRTAQIAALRSQLQDLKAELREYEALRSGRRTISMLPLLAKLPHSLIRARIARGLTQEELARKLGVKAQQVQRYEATDYRSASLQRLAKVARALDLMNTQSPRAGRRPPARAPRARKAARKGAAD